MNQYIRIVVCVAFSLLLAWVAFHGADWASVAGSLRHVDLRWVVASQAAAVLGAVVRAWRWSIVVHASGAPQHLRFRWLFNASQVGALVNFLIPARIGELVRSWMLARLAGLPVARCLAATALDRINDLASLLVVASVAIIAFPTDRAISLPAGLVPGIDTVVISEKLVRSGLACMAGMLLAAGGILALLYVNQQLIFRIVEALPGRASSWIARQLQHFAEGLCLFGTTAGIMRVMLVSLCAWLLNILSVAALMHGFGCSFMWQTPFLVFALTIVLISVPLTPGMVGQYHVSVIAALLIAMPDIMVNDARAFAIACHAIGLAQVLMLGTISLYMEGIGLKDIVSAMRKSK